MTPDLRRVNKEGGNELISLNEIKELIKTCLDRLYDKDEILFQRNRGKGVCERCLVFRFAHYLQDEIGKSRELRDYFVDCDFNSSYKLTTDEEGNILVQQKTGKEISNSDGTKTKRFVDIIVHRRIPSNNDDFIYFEIKKWNNTSDKKIKKDKNNLKRLTSASSYGYKYGFLLILGKVKDKTKVLVFKDSQMIEDRGL